MPLPSRTIPAGELLQHVGRVAYRGLPLHFGLNLAQLAGRRYRTTRRISASVQGLRGEDGRPAFDGLVYPSRNNCPAVCVALFGHAAPKVEVLADIDLVDHAGWPGFVVDWRIGIVGEGS